MNHAKAFDNVRTLGDIFALSLAEAGKPVPDLSPLFHGLAAYKMLNLKGVYQWLDDSVRIVMTEVMEEVKRRVQA
jgi:hypothetical protein